MDNLKINGWFDITRDSALGREFYNIPNTVVGAGKSSVASMIVSGVSSAVAFQWLAIGSGSSPPSLTDTALENECYGRINSSGAAIGSLCTFTGSFGISGNIAISEYGVFNNSSAGSMLCRASGTSVNFISGDILTLTYSIIVA